MHANIYIDMICVVVYVCYVCVSLPLGVPISETGMLQPHHTCDKARQNTQ